MTLKQTITPRTKLNKKSKIPNILVPQGVVISSILLNFYLFKMPASPEGIKIIQYADDVSIHATGVNFKSLRNKIGKFLYEVVEYLEERELQVFK